MAFEPADLFRSPNALAGHYREFRVDERILLTGHSHQAWPDCAREGQLEAWEDAARLVDHKWSRAAQRADLVREGYRSLLGDETGQVALAPNTHELVVRFLSALPLEHRPRLVTTDGEFHTVRRQLDRLAEDGRLEIVKVPSSPGDDLSERLAGEVDDQTAAVLVSAVLYRDAFIVPGLPELAQACRRVGTHLLIDAYHAMNVVPWSMQGLEDTFVVGGGYKYCQLGEGNCFLRFPADCTMRPIYTGWYAEFGELAQGERGSGVTYGNGPDRFAGATYDPTSHYRGARVFRFMREQNLNVGLLREVSQHQLELLMRSFDDLDADPSMIDRDRSTPLSKMGGFLALKCERAGEISTRLAERGVRTDFRGDILRLGPAPYLSDRQLTEGLNALGEVVAELEHSASPG